MDDTKKMTKLSVRLPDKDITFLQDKSEEWGINISETVRRILFIYLEQNGYNDNNT